MHWSCDVSAPWDYISYAVYPRNQSINQFQETRCARPSAAFTWLKRRRAKSVSWGTPLGTPDVTVDKLLLIPSIVTL